MPGNTLWIGVGVCGPRLVLCLSCGYLRSTARRPGSGPASWRNRGASAAVDHAGAGSAPDARSVQRVQHGCHARPALGSRCGRLLAVLPPGGSRDSSLVLFSYVPLFSAQRQLRALSPNLYPNIINIIALNINVVNGLWIILF